MNAFKKINTLSSSNGDYFLLRIDDQTGPNEQHWDEVPFARFVFLQKSSCTAHAWVCFGENGRKICHCVCNWLVPVRMSCIDFLKRKGEFILFFYEFIIDNFCVIIFFFFCYLLNFKKKHWSYTYTLRCFASRKKSYNNFFN